MLSPPRGRRRAGETPGDAAFCNFAVLADWLSVKPKSQAADRFLAATAKVPGLTLVTADERLLGLGEIATLSNR